MTVPAAVIPAQEFLIISATDRKVGKALRNRDKSEDPLFSYTRYLFAPAGSRDSSIIWLRHTAYPYDEEQYLAACNLTPMRNVRTGFFTFYSLCGRVWLCGFVECEKMN